VTNIVISILGNAQNYITATNNAQNATDKWAAKAGKAGLIIGGALAGAATAAVKSAADQSAAVSAWTQVTGKQMDAQQKTIARSLNLSQTDYAKSFTTLSSLYQSNGIAQDKANAMATKGLKTAADQAAFGNTTVGEAVEAQAGLLKGSGELLEKYAISITAADVAARMKADGTDKLAGAEGKAAKAVAKAALVQEQSAKFLGQAAKESGSLESRQQKLTATVEDFKAKMGEQLLPIVEKFIGKLQSAAEWVAKNETKTKIIVGVLAGFAAVLLTVATAIKVVRAAQAAWNAIMIATNVIMFANPVTLVVAAIVALGVAVVVCYKKFDKFRYAVNFVLKNVGLAVITLADTWLAMWGKIFGLLGKLPGPMGAPFRAAERAAEKARGVLDGFKAKLEALPTSKRMELRLAVNMDEGAYNAAVGRIQSLGYSLRAAQANVDAQNSFNAAGQYGPVPLRNLDGARAAGGPVTKGNTYLVGERGPELFTASMSGTIIPNSRLSGGKPTADPNKLSIRYGSAMVEGIIKGIQVKMPAVKNALGKALSKKDYAEAVKAAVAAADEALTASVGRMVEKMKAKFDAAKELGKGIKAAFVDSASLSGFTGGDMPGFSGLIAGLQRQADVSASFAKGITDLRKRGLNETSIRQLVADGASTGLAAVEALMAGGKSGIGQVNKLVGQISASGQGLGSRESKTRFGIDAFGGNTHSIKLGRQKVDVKIDLSGGGDELTEAIVKLIRKKIRIDGPGSLGLAR
jgi:hypothetical protein